ncbi:hypothetical protein VSU19_20060 [Verrucomicrobiales bacterium BCK34]|nr:hypothetical protein [Verrucomicrobiales bacterium BCK34]
MLPLSGNTITAPVELTPAPDFEFDGGVMRLPSIRSSLFHLATLIALSGVLPPAIADEKGTYISNRRELFVESALIESLDGDADLRLHHPVAREIVLEHDEPWEGTGSGYHSVFRDGDLYRMYYKAWHIEVKEGKFITNRHPLFCCYAESDDGINWRKPDLGIHEFEGSRANNIAIVSGKYGGIKADAGHPAVFLDENPNAKPEGKYKAILRSSGVAGLLVFQSSDGLNWTPLSKEPILQGVGAFDSQNLAFWDPVIGRYRAYWRAFSGGVTNEKEWKPTGVRLIRTATSEDLVNWSDHQDLVYENSPLEHLYTNQVKPYDRAPHILIGFPTRYVELGASESMSALPDPEDRENRAAASERYGYAVTEGLMMASRDGVNFKRWNEAFLRPGEERTGTWHYGAQYLAWHLVETKSTLPGAANELSLYATESYWHGKGSALRRYSLRLDGFVSVNAGWEGGELVTKPIIFEGDQLSLNFASSAAGGVRVEIQDPSGKPISGFSEADCPPHFGDTVDRIVHWKKGPDLSELSGKPVRIRFILKDADLYSYQFQKAD